MPDYPPSVLAAATAAIRDAFPGEFGKPGMPEPDALARAALEAAAPLLAGAWGAFECEPLRTDDIERLRGIEAMGRIIAYVESLPCNSGMLCGRCAALGREPHA